MSFATFLLFILQVSLAWCDISITAPVAGTSFSSSGSIVVKWKDSGAAPSLSDLTTITILVCTGPNAKINCFYTALPAQSLAGLNGQYSVPVASVAKLAASGPFFLQLYASGPGGFTIHYTDRFALSGLTGPLIPSDGGDTAPPANVVNYAAGGAAASTLNPLTGATVPFSLQSGAIKYAPMQMQPGPKVTHKLSATRRYPTSSVSYFTTWTMQPLQVTTMTPSITYSVSQYHNWAPVAPDPTGYYAASEALSRTINAKSRRGYLDL